MIREQQIELGTIRFRQGFLLKESTAQVTIYGDPLPDGSNVIWIIHALTANSRVHEWWPGMLGQSGAFDLENDAVICVNNLGSCYGSSGPASLNLHSGFEWGPDFPEFSIGDMADFLEAVRRHFGWIRIKSLIGASLGGQIALQWIVNQPERCDKLVLIASNAQHSCWGRAWNETQRMAIESDPNWGKPWLGKPEAGLKAARAMALLSYRTYEGYARSQDDPEGVRPKTYQRYQGEKLVKRFDAYSYYRLTQAMDSHGVGYGKEELENMLQHINTETLICSMQNDVLFPFTEQQLMYEHIPNSYLHVIPTKFGHDGFLIETKRIIPLIGSFLTKPTYNTLTNYANS